MCVILQCDKSIPKKDMLDNANKKNPHGGGFAYIKDGLVHWEKGMHVNAKYVAKYVKKHKLTAKNKLIVHFRIATHGEVNNMMCHPFPLGLDKSGQAVKNKTSGTTAIGVMFHNGVWEEYDQFAVKLAFNSHNIRIPDGDMSDSSIMAWCASHKGVNFLEFTGEKVIVLSPNGITRFGEGWIDIDNIECSNDYFVPHEMDYWGSFSDNFSYRPKSVEAVKMSADDYEDTYAKEHQQAQQFYCQDELDYLDGIEGKRYEGEPL